MSRFTLQPRRWYACTLLGDEFSASDMCTLSPTPIRINAVEPLATGDRKFKLAFFHANYPEGVQDKVYNLQTVHRGQRGILARSLEHSPPRFLYVTEITCQWISHYWPELECDPDAIQASLDRGLGRQAGMQKNAKSEREMFVRRKHQAASSGDHTTQMSVLPDPALTRYEERIEYALTIDGYAYAKDVWNEDALSGECRHRIDSIESAGAAGYSFEELRALLFLTQRAIKWAEGSGPARELHTLFNQIYDALCAIADEDCDPKT